MQASSPRASTTPVFLSFDGEPDGFQNPRGEGWRGMAFHIQWANRLREELSSASGRDPAFTWMIRTDPQMTQLYGTASYAAVAFETEVSQLAEHGDVFGVHVHPLRRRDADDVWVHDFADRAWNDECIESATDAFASAFGTPAKRYRHGAGFLDNETIETIDRLGYDVDLSLEPVAGWGLTYDQVETGVDSSPRVGAYVDCSGAPLHVYRPALHDFRVPADADGRSLVMVPLTASRLLLEKPWWWRMLRALKTPSSRQRARMLYPSGNWPDPTFFWDLVSAHIDSMDRPYLAFAIRTEAPETETAQKVCRLFDALPAHPVARRLEFVDPLEVAPGLVSG